MTTETQPDETLNQNREERSIFRVAAREHYLSNQDKVVFPRLLSQGLFIWLWIAAIILFIAGLVITFWPLLGIGIGG